MAGGRRPASYVSGARHGSAIERTLYENTPPAPPNGPAVAALPPWIPSIWQQASPKPVKDTHMAVSALPLPSRDRLAARSAGPGDPSSALAAALDTAVQSAVVRALGNSGDGAHVQSASTGSEGGVEEEGGEGWSVRERELTAIVETLQMRVDERGDEVRQLADRLALMERRVEAGEGRRREGEREAELEAQVGEVIGGMTQLERRVEGRMTAIHDQVKANQGGVAKLRPVVKGCEVELKSVKKWTREMATEMRMLEVNVSSEIEKSCAQTEHLEQCLSEATATMARNGNSEDQSVMQAKEVEELRRSVEASNEEVASMRSKVKRMETQIAEVSKQSGEMMALNGGFEESVRHSMEKVTSVIEGLRETIAQIQDEMPGGTDVRTDLDQDVSSRLDGLESNVKALKKLIESNLRTQWNAESIVKEQVSLITKHVCVAMRQYTARRISENNTLIDKALRARVPEYANNEEQFVLVREEDTEGNESIDIHRTSEASSTASS